MALRYKKVGVNFSVNAENITHLPDSELEESDELFIDELDKYGELEEAEMDDEDTDDDDKAEHSETDLRFIFAADPTIAAALQLICNCSSFLFKYLASLLRVSF